MKRALLACVIATFVLHTACGRKADREADSRDAAPRPPAEDTGTGDVPPASGMPSFDSSLEGFELDLALISVPDSMTLSYQDRTNLQLVSRTHPSVSFTVRSNSRVGDFQTSHYHGLIGEQVQKYAKGVAIGSGDFPNGPFGDTAWSAWRYEEDGELVEIVELVSPHPRGRGVVQLRSMYPVGVADAEQQAATLRDLLDRIESSG